MLRLIQIYHVEAHLLSDHLRGTENDLRCYGCMPHRANSGLVQVNKSSIIILLARRGTPRERGLALQKAISTLPSGSWSGLRSPVRIRRT